MQIASKTSILALLRSVHVHPPAHRTWHNGPVSRRIFINLGFQKTRCTHLVHFFFGSWGFALSEELYYSGCDFVLKTVKLAKLKNILKKVMVFSLDIHLRCFIWQKKTFKKKLTIIIPWFWILFLFLCWWYFYRKTCSLMRVSSFLIYFFILFTVIRKMKMPIWTNNGDVEIYKNKFKYLNSSWRIISFLAHGALLTYKSVGSMYSW